MKKIINMLSIICLIILVTGCSNDKENNDKLSIVTTIYPTYDWINEITNGSDNIEITLLGDTGIDFHSYQATTEDIVAINNADLFVYVGGESEEWVYDVLETSKNKDIEVVNLLSILGDKAIIEEHEHHEEENHDEHEHSNDIGHYDEHVWLSLMNAEIFVNDITNSIIKIDEANSKLYEENRDLYINKIKELEEEYAKTISESREDTLLFGDRFPFVYLTNDYDIKVHSALSGCSTESEASFEVIKELSDEINNGISYIIDLTDRNHNIPEAINNAAKEKVQILTLNSLQSIKESDLKNTSYLSVMEDNLEVIKKALSGN